MEKAWILVGMMGVGKSSVGRALAELSGREFQDTDQILQHRLGRSIAQVFQIYGEEAFRDHETSVLDQLQPGPMVLATGGGIVGREDNWRHLRRLGHTIFLDASFDTLRGRLAESKKKRPLLADEDWEERLAALLEKRLPLYKQADIHVAIQDEAVLEAAQSILQAIEAYDRSTPQR